MRRLPPVLLLLALAAPRPALPAEGLFLTWNDCVLAPAASFDKVNACGSDFGSQVLFCSFQVGAPVDSVLGMELVVDIQHSDPVLPDWWQLGPDGCRAAALSASFDFGLYNACTDIWLNEASGGLQGYYATEPRGQASQARVKAAAAVTASSGYRGLDPGPTYYAVQLLLSNAHTSTCTGCGGTACLVLNSILVHRKPGAIGGDVFLQAPGAGPNGWAGNWASWQARSAADCSAVPVRSVTWGRIKSLYR